MPAVTSGDERHPRGVGRPAQAALRERGVGVEERARLRVARVAELDRVGERRADRWCERDIHLGDEHGQHVGGMRHPLGTAAASEGLQR
jgi:hypothetical protein